MPIDPKISVVVSTLTLASRMAGFGRPMCPLDVLRTYLHPIYGQVDV
jgi:hypothetical protein